MKSTTCAATDGAAPAAAVLVGAWAMESMSLVDECYDEIAAHEVLAKANPLARSASRSYPLYYQYTKHGALFTISSPSPHS